MTKNLAIAIIIAFVLFVIFALALLVVGIYSIIKKKDILIGWMLIGIGGIIGFLLYWRLLSFLKGAISFLFP
jgi:hypothetical protein